jgi:hypothetical protein
MTSQGRGRDRNFYLVRIIIHAAIVVAAFVFVNSFGHSEDRIPGNVLAGLLVFGGYAPWRNFILHLKYDDEDAYIEVDGSNLWICNRHGKAAFPLHEVRTFVHKKRGAEVVELRAGDDHELDLRDYENMSLLVEDLRRSPAGTKYELQA